MLHSTYLGCSTSPYDFAAVARVLDHFDSVFFDPLSGNNGDSLITMGALKLLSKLGKKRVSDLRVADAVVINGGGGMRPRPSWGAWRVLENYVRGGSKSIVVLPQSFYFQEVDLQRLAELTATMRCNLTLFARELRSLKRLDMGLEKVSKSESGIDFAISPDLAFSLSPEEILESRKRQYSRRPYALVVERRDSEASTDVPPERAISLPLKGVIPNFIKRPMKRELVRRRTQNTKFVLDCSARIKSECGAVDIMVGDVSDKSMFSFDDFISLIANAELVFSTRLHVAILCHILRKRCYLARTGGEYAKNESVYEYSMSDSNYVRMI